MGESPFTGEPGTSSAAGGTWGNSGDTPTEQGERVTLYRCPRRGWHSWATKPAEYVMDEAESREFVPASALTEAEQRAERAERSAHQCPSCGAVTYKDTPDYRTERDALIEALERIASMGWLAVALVPVEPGRVARAALSQTKGKG